MSFILFTILSFFDTPANQGFGFIIVAGLIIYIGYLHYMLTKKNSHIKSVEDKLHSIHSEFDTDTLEKVYNKSQSDTNQPSKKRDKILQKNILDFIFEDEKHRKIFMHYTKDEDDAKKILKEGFKFVDSFYKTAEEVRNDETDLVYKHNRHKSYGDYLIIISIDKDIYNYYVRETDKVPSYEIVVEQLLTEQPPYLNDDSEMVYTFHHKFIKGYVEYMEGRVVENPEFNPEYNTYQFFENLKKLTYKD